MTNTEIRNLPDGALRSLVLYGSIDQSNLASDELAKRDAHARMTSEATPAVQDQYEQDEEHMPCPKRESHPGIFCLRCGQHPGTWDIEVGAGGRYNDGSVTL